MLTLVLIYHFISAYFLCLVFVMSMYSTNIVKLNYKNVLLYESSKLPNDDAATHKTL